MPLYAADVGIMPLAVDSTSGSTQSASFATNTFGGTTSGAYQNQFDYMGRYRFNICGNTVVRGKVDSQWGYVLHSDTAAESRADYFEKNDVVSYDLPSGACTTNSSSSALANRGGNPTIRRAFLVVTVTCRLDGREMNRQTNPLSKYGVSLKGPRGALSRFFPNRIYVSTQKNGSTGATETGGRQVCFFDVTSFVQQQGYGTYTGVNIPFSCRTKYSESTPGSPDLVGSWKLIVIEESSSLPIRKLQLKLGGAPVNASTVLTAAIGGNGLFVAKNATGETLASLDAADPDEGNQMLSYTTSKNSSLTDLYCGADRPANNFFTFKVDINGASVWQSPGMRSSMRPLYGTSRSFNTCNTDLSLMSINGSAGTMRLAGDETNVTLRARVTDRDVIVSALGIAADVVTPTFDTTLHVSDLTRNWSTSDPGYDGSKHFAIPGDKLRAVMISTNTSDQQYLGLANSKITFTLPAFATIDKSTVVARFLDQYGRVTNFSNISVSGNTLTVSASDGLQVRKGSYFEIACEGTAAGGNAMTTYRNSCSLSGALVDTTGTTQSASYIDNLGQAARNTTADGAKYDFTASCAGPGSVGVVNTAAGLPASGPYAGSASLYGSATGHAAWRPNTGAHVAFVMVDGQLRCDLESADRVSVPMANSAHSVFVSFAEGAAPEKGAAPYTVTTSGDEGLAALTPTTDNLPEGAAHEVTWVTEPGWEVAEIKVDGVPVPVRSTTKVIFDHLAGNHEVAVRTTPVPDERLAVRTSVIGPGTITASSTVTPGQNYPVSWSGSVSGAILNYVKVNGVTVFDKNKDLPKQPQTRPGNTGQLPVATAGLFANIQNDVSIEVCYIDPGRTPATPEPYKVTTQLIGGAGAVTPTLTVSPGGTADLSWTPATSWEVSSVTVIRGDSRTTYAPNDPALKQNGLGIKIENVRSDCLVEVALRRGVIDIVTENAGAGAATLTPTLRDVKAGSTPRVDWSVPPGSHIASVIVDGVVRDDLLAAGFVEFPNVQTGHRVTVVTASDKKPDGGGEPGNPDDPNVPLPPDWPDNPTDPVEGDLFRIDVTCSGAGTAGPSALVKAGTDHAVSWNGTAGAKPMAVYVDGAAQPGLLATGGLTLKAVGAHHRVHVVFPADPAAPDGPQPDDPDEGRFTVSTRITGGPGTIAGTASYAPGENASVSWTVGAGFRVKKVTVDGEWRPALTGAAGTDFPAIDANHEVVVELEEDLWRVDVSWDGNGTAGQSATVRAGDSHRVTWVPKGAATVLRVLVDGVEQPALAAAGAIDFSDIHANHTVHVVFDQDPPDDELWRHVAVNIVGGPGECTGSDRVPVGDDHEVTWAADTGWRVTAVIVDGTERPALAGAGSYTFPDVRENHSVVVRLEKIAVDGTLSLETDITGGGSAAVITPTERNVPMGANRTVSWTVPAGWHVSSVTVDGVSRDDLLRRTSVDFPVMSASHRVVVVLEEGAPEPAGLYRIDVDCTGTGMAGPSAVVAPGGDHLVTWRGLNGERPLSVEVDGVARPDLLDAGGIPFHTVYGHHTVSVVFPEADRDDLCHVRTSLTGGAGTITGSAAVPAGSDAEVVWAAASGYRVKSVTVDGTTQDRATTRWGFSAVSTDHEVAVEVEMDLWRVNVTWEGQGTAGASALVRPGADHRVTWKPDPGRKVLRVEVDGADRPELVDTGFVDLAAIDGDHSVHVVFDRDPSVAAWHRVDVTLSGGPGTASGSGEVPGGTDRTVSWAPAPGFRVASVIVDGEERPDLVGAGGHTFADIQGDHRVEVVLEPEPVAPPDAPAPKPDDPEGPTGPDNPGGNGDGGSGNGSGTGPDWPGTGASEAGDPQGGRGDGNRGGFSTALLKLAQTGDPWALLALSASAIALASGACLLALRRRRR